MATQDNNPGLLSKVARFVRNPTKDWTELDKPESAPDIDHSKEALKLVIERKRRDNAIRKREFSQLRKLRQASPEAKAELSQGMSAFRSSSGDLDADTDERATTLKKIDEIEAQMSRQWWKGRSGAIPLAARNGDERSAGQAEAFPVTQRVQLPTTPPEAPTPQEIAANFDFEPTKPGSAPVHPLSNEFEVSAQSAFSPSKLMLIDLGQNMADPELEEAAIRFANGDDAGAEAALQAALGLPDASPALADGWFAALFDLYRCTQQKANFDRMALAYAQRFGRSAPPWSLARRSMETSRVLAVQAATVLPSAGAGRHWLCPPYLDDAAVAQLRDMVVAGSVTYSINWSALKHVSDSAATGLAELLAQWCDTPLSLCFDGVEALVQVLRALTPINNSSVPKQLWQLRFDVLSLLRLQDDYEMAALDFCVTFEMSPPPWRTPVCQRPCGPQTHAPELATQDAPQLPSGTLPPRSVMPGAPEPEGQMALVGEVSGDVSDIVAQWQLAEGEGGLWLVSCTQLTRIDFSAAGGLLNWVTHMAAEGKQVEFRDVPHLVAAFLYLIGINEHARVTARTN